MLEYSNKIVFFIDILAFKEMIKKSEPLQIYNMLDCIKKCSQNEYNYNPLVIELSSRMMTQFSDAICISFDYNDPTMLFMSLQNISKMQERCLEQEVLLRGGCAIGKAVHNDKYLFGPAVNEAYKLESEVAIYPRVIISQDIIKNCINNCITNSIFNNELKLYFEEQIKKYLKQDTDGYYYIDYLSLPTAEISSNDAANKFVEKIQTNRMFIEDGLKNPDIKIKSKYGWLADKFNKSFSAEIIDYYSKHFNIDLNHTKALFSL